MDERGFGDAIAGPNLVLVVFSPSWCGPCRAMAPALETRWLRPPRPLVLRPAAGP